MTVTSCRAERFRAVIVIRVREGTGAVIVQPCATMHRYSVSAYRNKRRDSATLSVR